MTDPLQIPEAPLSWIPGAATLPAMPMLPPGEDPMSAMISGLLPTLSTELEGEMAALTGKEEAFAGKLGTATAQYAGADASGGDSVQQLVDMLGQVGDQAGEMAGAPGEMGGSLGGGAGAFSSLMQPAMQAGQNGGASGGEKGSSGAGTGGAAGGGGQSSGGSAANTGQGSPGAGSQQQPKPDDGAAGQDQPELAEPLDQNHQSMAQADEGADVQHRTAPAPVSPPSGPSHSSGDDFAQRM